MENTRVESTRLSVSIVTYNSSLELLSRTLLSLQAAASMAVRDMVSAIDVTLVDNASEPPYRDGLAALVADLPGQGGFSTEILALDTNLGYGGGHNRALDRDTAGYHLVLNPDVELAEDALVAGLAYLQSNPGTVLVSPRATGPDGNQEFLCKRQPTVLVLLLRAIIPGIGQRLFPGKMAHYEMRDVCTSGTPAAVPLASGCFMLARGAALEACGGFDRRYFMYFEDFDLSLRLAARGAVEYLPAMRIVHHGGYAGRKGFAHIRMFATGALRFFRQHGWRWF